MTSEGMEPYRCEDCGQPITDEHYGRMWGRGQWRHRDHWICIAALGAAVNRLSGGGDEWGMVPAPSDEAVKAARKVLWSGSTAHILAAAYAIDLPRARAEERAATLREVQAALEGSGAFNCGPHHGYEYPDELVAAILAGDFNPEAERCPYCGMGTGQQCEQGGGTFPCYPEAE